MTALSLLLILSAISCVYVQAICPILPIDRTTHELFRAQPRFVTLVPRFVKIAVIDPSLFDHNCITYQPLDGSLCTLKAIVSWVYANGTSLVLTFVVKSDNPGILRYISPLQSYTDVVFTFDGPTDYELQSNGESSYVIGETTIWRQYSNGYPNILNKYGFNPQDYRVLPMKLPCQCVFGP